MNANKIDCQRVNSPNRTVTLLNIFKSDYARKALDNSESFSFKHVRWVEADNVWTKIMGKFNVINIK